MDLSIVIPCYNEVENVPKLQEEFLPVALELAQTRSVEVVFVDDGCTDGTWEALHDAFGEGAGLPGIAFQFERHSVNRGLGAAIRTGLAAARGEMVLTTDSDGTYKFSEIPGLLSCLTDDVDIVTASPYHPSGGVAGVPAYRLLFSRGCSAIYRLLADWRVYTYTCLFRAYRREVIENVTFESDGFLAGTELMVKGMLMGYQVAEHPAVLYRRAYGESKAKIKRTVLAHLEFQARVLAHRLGLKPMADVLQVAAEMPRRA
jgi:dolichol-phosphate mannosyltransferase